MLERNDVDFQQEKPQKENTLNLEGDGERE